MQQFVAQSLGLNLDDRLQYRTANALVTNPRERYSPEDQRLAQSCKLTPAAELELSIMAQRHKGVLIGVHCEVLKRYQVSDGDFSRCGTEIPPRWTPADLRILVPDGLPIELITGIEPLGEREIEFIVALRSTGGLA